ncbi:MAG TPA: pilus assembly protein PilM [Verrucomicrobiae bacterium]|nr:pilus assembly protein PilM [Verrucomicrobiae bacterium]
MLASLTSGPTKKRAQVVAVDLGGRTTKAVQIVRKGSGFELVNFACKETPVSDKALSAEAVADHLKAVLQAVSARTKHVTLIVGHTETLLRHAELPLIPITDARMMLKFNSKNYLQQDFPEHTFDLHLLPLVQAGAMDDGAPKAPPTKGRYLVGGAKSTVLTHYQQAAKLAGVTLDMIVPAAVAPANAFEMAQPEVFQNEVVALVDLGHDNSSISILKNGELILFRVVQIGAKKVTHGLAESLGVSVAEAEQIKIGLPDEVTGPMQSLLMPLGRELRASIDFVEHQQDKAVSQAYMSGGSARSPFVIETLQSELMVPSQTWNPTSFMTMALPPPDVAEIEQSAPQLTVAVGGAMAAF